MCAVSEPAGKCNNSTELSLDRGSPLIFDMQAATSSRMRSRLSLGALATWRLHVNRVQSFSGFLTEVLVLSHPQIPILKLHEIISNYTSPEVLKPLSQGLYSSCIVGPLLKPASQA